MKHKPTIIVVSVLLLASLACRTAQRLGGGNAVSQPQPTTGQAVEVPTTAPPAVPTFPEPTVTSTITVFDPEPGLLFVDDFSDRASGWPVEYSDDSVIDYFQEGYHIAVNAPESLVWSVVGPNFQNVRINVDARLIGGGEDNYLGLICRYQDANNFYTGVISSDGFYAIMRRYQGGSMDFISSDRFEESIVINQHLDLNLLELVCVGNQISLSVNGQLVSQVEDDAITTGDVGLLVGTISAESTDILFDNFTLYLEE